MKLNQSAVDTIRGAAKKALSEGAVKVVIGYSRQPGNDFSGPIFVTDPANVDRLQFDDSCFGNLAVYLSRPEVKKLGKIGIVVKGCDLRAVNVLIREHVVKREDLLIIGVSCAGVGEPLLEKCALCDVHTPEGCDVIAGDPIPNPASDGHKRFAKVDQIESLPLEKRWAYRRKELGKCIRCYACRQVCPLCCCKRCIIEKTEPQWVETSAHLRGNVAWNAVRAFHLTGRCVACGECERVCPESIPLSTINAKMAKLVDEWFAFRSGLASDEKAPFTTWSPNDPENDIL